MSKRKVQFEDDAAAQGDGSRRFKEKHSLDSDEEDEVIEEKLDEDDIEGQEEGTVDYEEGIKITPFNMREEMEEGHFDKDGMYIFSKDKDQIRDEWIDNIDWQKIKEVNPGEMLDRDDSDSEPEPLDLKSAYSEMVKYLKPGETIAKALRRLGGNKGKQMSSSQRWKAKKQKKEETEEDKQAAKNKEDFLTLTGHADNVLQDGNMEVYEMTLEKLIFELKKIDKEKDSERLVIPEEANDDDALDMFAEDFDNKKADKIEKVFDNASTTENGTKPEDKTKDSKAIQDIDEVMWEYKWEDKDDAEIHGPYSSSEMLKWSEDDYFKAGVFCRKAGTQNQFYTSRRIDFDLYT